MEDKIAIFTQYSELQALVEAKEEELADAKEELADCVGAIADTCGKGPFKWQKQELRVATRKDKHYMRTSNAEVEEIG